MKICGLIPAAGRGTRLGAAGPKILMPLTAQDTIWSLLYAKLAPLVDHIHLVLSPEGAAVFPPLPADVSSSIQPAPTGMGDAIFRGSDVWSRYDAVLVIWGDQVSVSTDTLSRTIAALNKLDHHAVLPVTRMAEPYVEYVFDGPRLTRVLQTREGDRTTPNGFSDVGTFLLGHGASNPPGRNFLAGGQPQGERTGEINFCPLPALSSAQGWTIPPLEVADATEARGHQHKKTISPFSKACIRTPHEKRVGHGGAGCFIGSHLSEGLLARGYRVRVLDSLGLWQARMELRQSACGSSSKATSVMPTPAGAPRPAWTGVFHCAAMSRSGPSQEQIDVVHPVQHHRYPGTCCWRRGMPASGVSSMAAPPRPMATVRRRTGKAHPCDLLNIYGLTKRVGEQYCLLFDEGFDLPCVVLRYFNAYGPRQPETGAYALVLGIFLNCLAEGKPLEIHGDGSQRRDFVHVRDVVAANIDVLESSIRGEVFNVGSGTGISVKELADMISPNQIHTAARQGDSMATLADISKIRCALGWTPKVTFEDGLNELMAK